METKCPVIGIDVAKEFSYYCILGPDGKVYRDSFRAENDLKGLTTVLSEAKKAEKEFGLKPVVILESTGHYSNPLVHFFAKKELTILLVNPLQSHSIKNSQIRKLKNDKVDAKELAELYFLKEFRPFRLSDAALENLKVLTRAFASISEQRVTLISQLTASVEQVMPRYTGLFSDIASKTSLTLLKDYSSPDQMLKAPKEEVVHLIRKVSRKSEEYATEKYTQLMNLCHESQEIGVLLDSNYQLINLYAKMIKSIDVEIEELNRSITDLSKQILAVDLIKSIPGIGDKTAPALIAEIGEIERFDNAKQLIAYCGIDPSVRQSGKFTGTKNKLTKRGSKHTRRSLYMTATVAVRKGKNGKCVNPVMHDFYQEKIKTKHKKQALGAVMNKLVRVIFSVLKNKQPFVLITPEEQVKMYQANMKIAA